MIQISLRQERMLATMKTACECSCNLLRTLAKPQNCYVRKHSPFSEIPPYGLNGKHDYMHVHSLVSCSVSQCTLSSYFLFICPILHIFHSLCLSLSFPTPLCHAHTLSSITNLFALSTHTCK